MTTVYKIADLFFIVFHTSLIIFNLFGWIWKPLRKTNLATLLLTGGSWFILGIFFGPGYCPLTDWHFDILLKLGTYPGTDSYIQYIIYRLTGIRLDGSLVNTWTLILYFLALLLSVYFNFFRTRRSGSQ